ncbi:BamA/TamA family outer membrane protein [Chitinophaga sp. Hz27]|uniref:BamA/TamA family outer membrane protein n=1 Tax=Chitinophaga sp. Hz27 TaxID=3347169 RepID=UPI0035D79AD7
MLLLAEKNSWIFFIKPLVAVGLVILLLCSCLLVQAQDSIKQKPAKWKFTLHDSLDHAIDLSDWIINANGFVPVPDIITEPAVGFGGAIAPILMHKHHQPVQTLNRYKKLAPIPPDITGGFAFYTASKSWGAGLFRSGTIVPWHLSYKVFAGYMNMNLNFYKTLPSLGEVKFKTNIKSIPAFLRLQKQLGYSNWSAGIQYVFVKTTAKQISHILPDSLFKPKELDNISSIPGVLVEFDNRDNIFTPNKGSKIHVDANFSYEAFGSDFNYTHMNGFFYKYFPIGHKKKWVSGFRGDYQQVIGDIPFYFKPSLDLRGIPRGRYQGNVNMLAETEQRWNVFRRWSAVFFTGVGKVFDEYADFGSSGWEYNYGTGFRYMLARKFGLYMGADVARGPEQWGFYIQFGSAWLK